VILPVIFRRVAQAEFDDAAVWYNDKRAGLGTVFIRRVQETLDQIAANPEWHAVVYKDEVRCAPVARFPYSVYYQAQSVRVVIIAVFHNRRDPAVWQARV
jgi:plasmid stabilization system protein ParE